MKKTTIEKLLSHACDNRDHLFLTDIRRNREYCYGDLLVALPPIQAFFSECKIPRAARVGFVTKNHPFLYPLLLACMEYGLTLVPLNPDRHTHDIQAILADAGVSTVFTDQCHDHDLCAMLTEKYDCHIISDTDTEGFVPSYMSRAETVTQKRKPIDEALIIYTSGTTQQSKGVILTPTNLCAMAEAFTSFYHYGPQQKFLCMLPFYHINAPMITGLACIHAGAHIYLTDPFGFTNAKFIWNMVALHRIQALSITPSIMAALLKLFPDGTNEDIRCISYALVGTAHLSEELWRTFESTFHIPCYQGYGLTETTTWNTMTPPDNRKKYTTAGIPVAGEVVIDTKGSTIQYGEHCAGQILIRGDIVMKGYNNRKKLTAGQFKNGWFKTGDIGYFDNDGQLVIVGRIKNIIKRKGILIFPEEIDNVLKQHPSVENSCTFGIPDDLLGEKVVTVYEIKKDASESPHELLHYLHKEISSAYCPNEIICMKAPPKNPLGKYALQDIKDIVTGTKAQCILDSIASGKFQRAPMDTSDAVYTIIQNALITHTQVCLAGLWGCGIRPHVNDADTQALAQLVAIRDTMNEAAGKEIISVHLILADMHATVNEVPQETMQSYLSAIKDHAERAHMHCTYLSMIWQEHVLDYTIEIARINTPEFHALWHDLAIKDELIQQALQRGFTPERAEQVAWTYYTIRCAERKALEETYRNAIFFTYGLDQEKIFLPSRPIMHIFSLKKGISQRPWFME